MADQYITYLQVEEFDLEPLEPCVVSVDGEVYDFTPTHISVVPGAINFVVPKGSEIIK